MANFLYPTFSDNSDLTLEEFEQQLEFSLTKQELPCTLYEAPELVREPRQGRRTPYFTFSRRWVSPEESARRNIGDGVGFDEVKLVFGMQNDPAPAESIRVKIGWSEIECCTDSMYFHMQMVDRVIVHESKAYLFEDPKKIFLTLRIERDTPDIENEPETLQRFTFSF